MCLPPRCPSVAAVGRCLRGFDVELQSFHLDDADVGALAAGAADRLAPSSAPRRPGRLPWDRGRSSTTPSSPTSSSVPRRSSIDGGAASRRATTISRRTPRRRPPPATITSGETATPRHDGRTGTARRAPGRPARDRRQMPRPGCVQLEHEEHDRGDEQDHADDLDRQHPERRDREDQRGSCPSVPQRRRPGMNSSTTMKRQAEPEEDEGEVRVQQRVEEVDEPAHRARSTQRRAGRVERDSGRRRRPAPSSRSRRARSVGTSGAIRSITPWSERLLGRDARRRRARTTPRTSAFRPVGLGDAPDGRRGVVHGLLASATAPDRPTGVRGADVRAGRHRGDGRRQQDERAGGGGPGSLRRHVADHRDRASSRMACVICRIDEIESARACRSSSSTAAAPSSAARAMPPSR